MTDDKHTMGGFIPGFPKLLRFQAHHKHVLGRALPKLKGHVSRCLRGFTHPRGSCSASSTRPPFPLTLRLWEASMLEGGHLLTAMAYTVLKVHRRKRA
ncbi:USP6 N-terminal-like protein [Bubalus bubalis]|uniref:USP6 N-terminal-like protein n=1 Tax=Bubalus bubalis TaxID=89462 RepID=UPI000DBC5E89|nr:USP6 N-terminal-like protein [Bubalus bubalis]